MLTITRSNLTSLPGQKWNKKQAINQFVRQYPIPFDMKDDAIDLREMSKNYDHELIPLDDIQSAIITVLGPKYNIPKQPVDPSDGATIVYGTASTKPRFGYIEWNEGYLWPIFQRDVAPNHVEKIYKDFDDTAVIVPCAIKITLSEGELAGKPIYCIWDGHHTMQVCRMEGYTKFPVWYIDVDAIPVSVIENAGFGDTDAERIKYGAFIAGLNMRRINGRNKRPLSPYDDFMVGYETRDRVYVSMMNILRNNKCIPKRNASCAGAFTQIKSGIECFELPDVQGNKNGVFWARAVALHRKHWPGAPLVLEMFRPLSYLYQEANIQGIDIPPAWDDEFALMLINKWGDAESIQEEIKKSFWAAYHDTTGANKLHGNIPDHDKQRVLAGMINFYKQQGGKVILPNPSCQWIV